MASEIGPPDDLPPAPPRAEQVRELLGLITEPEFAAAIGCELRTAQAHRVAGGPYPPVVRFGRSIVIPIESAREWLRQQAEGVGLEVVHRRPPKGRR